MDKNEIRKLLEDSGFTIKESRYKNIAFRLKLNNGVAVFCGDGGVIWYKGKQKDLIKRIIDENYNPKPNKKVFVVYGHDEEARNQLELILHRWNLEPLFIDQLPSEGRTIIEQLEKYIPQANFGLVLATPDDMGYPKDNENAKKYRARQNVVMELGMLLSKLGRSRVVVINKKTEDFEQPSDINGIIYKEYENNVEEIATKLARELIPKGYIINL